MFRFWKFITFVFGLVLSVAMLAVAEAKAATKWEVAIVFLGEGEPEEFQQDADENMRELIGLKPGEFLRVSVHREFSDRYAQVFLADGTHRSASANRLFHSPPKGQGNVVGDLASSDRAKSTTGILEDPARLRNFLDRAFLDRDSHRVLFLYGHGEGPAGLRSLKIRELRSRLEKALPARGSRAKNKTPPLDLLWLDSCYMANLEALYEIRSLSRLIMASEDDEFSAGSPFESLQELEAGPDDLVAAASELGTRFIESYSYLRAGSQHQAVYKSSATLSLIDTARLPQLVESLSALVRSSGRMAPELRRALSRKDAKRRMNRPDLADLGSLLLGIKRQKLVKAETRSKVEEALALLELSRPARLKTNPRIRLRPPRPESLVVYGYNGWKQGFEGDETTLARIPKQLEPKGFVPGPDKRSWPARGIKKQLYASPFSVGLNSFQYFFADAKTFEPLSEPETATRASDFVTFVATSPLAPILWNGYTQGVGSVAERYSGLSVLDPTQDAADLDYLDLEFTQATGWGNF